MKPRRKSASEKCACACLARQKKPETDWLKRLTEQLGHLPAGSAGAHIGALRLRIPGGPGLDASGISDAIAAAISSKLTRTQSHPHA